MKNTITCVLGATIILAISGLAQSSEPGGKKKGPPNSTRSGGGAGTEGKGGGSKDRTSIRQPLGGGGSETEGEGGGKGKGGGNGTTQTKGPGKGGGDRGTDKDGKGGGKKGGGNNTTQKKKKRPSLVELLGLKGEAAKKFIELNKERHQKIKRISESKMSPAEKAVRIAVVHKEFRKALEGILSDEQLAKLRLIHLRRAQGSGGNDKKPPFFGKYVAKALKLTAEQIKKLAAVRLHACKKKYAVLTNKKLSDEEKKAALKEIHVQVRRRINEILTDEQLAMLKKIHEKARDLAGGNGKRKSGGNPGA